MSMKFTIEPRNAAHLIAALAYATWTGRDIEVEIDDDGYIYVSSSHACTYIKESE